MWSSAVRSSEVSYPLSRWSFSCKHRLIAPSDLLHISFSEQLVPMFGLVALEHTIHPSTTIEKIVFLVENVFTHSNRITTIISFSALAILMSLRYAKNMFQKHWWIYRMPEVLVVVIISTSMFLSYHLL
jgi:hypothetical protein